VLGRNLKVVVAMSGGVDSSVAAAILKEQGYEVIGVTMKIWPSDKQADDAERFGGCCGVGAVEDAKKVAHKLGIPHYVMNFRSLFTEKVIEYFCREYSQGRTPNPCIKCNQYVKFDALMEKAKELDVDLMATGHYARIETVGERYLLKKGVDQRKDQSYFLYPMTQQQLAHTLLPVGNLTKAKVREMARKLDLPVAEKPESQEICFIPDDDYSRFLQEHIPQAVKAGPILDKQGRVLGQHRGILFYTVGQRKRLGVFDKEPRYVTAIAPDSNAIIVGSKQEVYGDELVASEMNWIAITGLNEPITAKAKIRYLHPEAETVIKPLGEDKVYLKFAELQMAITPGQAVVFYDGDVVIGGGTIERVGK
jgi:tRNA-specific 2-thiouridylase